MNLHATEIFYCIQIDEFVLIGNISAVDVYLCITLRIALFYLYQLLSEH